MSSTIPAGWYPDPEREGATRWWDGTQWAPSQELAASDDRFKPKDETDAGAAAQPGAESWSAEPRAGSGTAWDGSAASAAGANDASWQQQETPSWQEPQASMPSYGAPQGFDQTGAQQWNSYGAQPKKSRTGLFVGIGAGVLVLLLLLVGGGIWGISTFLSNANPQVETQGGGDLEIGQTYRVSVPVDQTVQLQVVLPDSGFYTIAANTVNDEDPVLTLVSSTGEEWRDDDDGGYPNSLIEESLDAGTYTLIVEEYGNNSPLEVDVTLTRG